MTDRLDEMRATVSYLKQQLYIAKNPGLGRASPARIAELERSLATRVELLRGAERDSANGDGE